ncbi:MULTISPECIES: phage protein [unclassified Paenibacillus]|uniref:phage protein n=1 Tax=unclassified Paenibacillus TaxID=185978 RepID=UPI003635D833
MNNFGRVAEIQTGTKTFSNQSFTMEFTVPFDNDLLPNESEIKIYNLSDSTLAEIELGNTLIINAGYEGDAGMILHGYISRIKTAWSGVDKITTIHVLDSDKLSDRKLEDITYAEDTLASIILKEMAEQLGLPVAQFVLNQDVRYAGGYTASGEVTDIIKKIAADCGTSAYINKGHLYIRNLREGTDDVFELSQDTGLIGMPEPFDEDYFSGMHLKSQLQHRITTASVVRLFSRQKEATLHIRKGSHKMNSSDFVTEMEGIYP